MAERGNTLSGSTDRGSGGRSRGRGRGHSGSLWECDDFRPQLNFLKALSVDNRNNKTGPQTLPQTSNRAHTHTHRERVRQGQGVTNVLKPLKYSTSQRMAEDTRTEQDNTEKRNGIRRKGATRAGARYGPITKYVPSSQIFKMFFCIAPTEREREKESGEAGRQSSLGWPLDESR